MNPNSVTWNESMCEKKNTSIYNFFELLASFSLFEFLKCDASFSIFEFLSFFFNTIYKSYYILFINLIVLFYTVNVSYYTIQLTFNFIFIFSAKSQFRLNNFLPNGQTICFTHYKNTLKRPWVDINTVCRKHYHILNWYNNHRRSNFFHGEPKL